nr:hypothetical protein [Pseudomonas sp. 37 R 15]
MAKITPVSIWLCTPALYFPVQGEKWPHQVGAEIEDQHHQAEFEQQCQGAGCALEGRRLAVPFFVRQDLDHFAAADQIQAQAHLDEVAGGHQGDAQARSVLLKHQAAYRRAEDGTDVHHDRQQADGNAVLIGLLQAHQIRKHQQVAGLGHEHEHGQQPIGRGVGCPDRHHAEQRGGELCIGEQVHSLDSPSHPCPHRQHAHHGDGNGGNVGTHMHWAVDAVAVLEKLRVERDQNRITDNAECRHDQDDSAQRHEKVPWPSRSSKPLSAAGAKSWKAVCGSQG